MKKRLKTSRKRRVFSLLVTLLLLFATVLASVPSVSAGDVPGLDTSKIGTFAYIDYGDGIDITGDDLLAHFLDYQQHNSYVDGVMRIWDTGGQSGEPDDNYCDVYVRVRTDGWMMAFFPDDAHKNDNWFGWTLDNYENRADLVWWGHTSGHICQPNPGGFPPQDSTRLGRALFETWEAVKADPDNLKFDFSYSDVGYYDYEYQSAKSIYIFGCGRSIGTGSSYYYYFTIPLGTNVYTTRFSYGCDGSLNAYLNEVPLKRYNGDDFSRPHGINTNGYWQSQEYKGLINMGGEQNTVRLYAPPSSSWGYLATVIFADN